jgi:hypothetical protein
MIAIPRLRRYRGCARNDTTLRTAATSVSFNRLKKSHGMNGNNVVPPGGCRSGWRDSSRWRLHDEYRRRHAPSSGWAR